MRERSFAAARRARWERLTETLERVEGSGIARLSAAEVGQLAVDYRAATSDLAAARGRRYDPALVAALERLTARAHATVYAGTARSGGARAIEFLRRGFPREIVRSWRPITICIALTIVTALVASDAVGRDPANAYALLPAEAIQPVRGALHDTNFGFDPALAPAMHAAILTNNVRVAIMAVAGGVTGGIFTLYIIGTNGLMVGTFGALFARAGYGADYWATIAPHGVIELAAIQIAGGAGLLLAGGIVRPGRLVRGEALREAGRRAGRLVLGVAALLAVAATIEAFVTPRHLPIGMRAAIGVLTAIALGAYVALGSDVRARLGRDVRVERGDGQARRRHVDDEQSAAT